MKIVLNGRQLHFPNVGTGVYTQSLLTHMSSLAPADEFYVITNASSPRSTFGTNVQFIATGQSIEVASIRTQLYWEQVVVPQRIKHLQANLLHVPYLGGSCFLSCPQVITVFDIDAFQNRLHQGHLRTRIYYNTQIRAVKQAALIITASEHSKSEIAGFFDLSTEKVRVIPLAARDMFSCNVDKDQIERTIQQHSITKPFILYAGGATDRKNIETLIAAYSMLDRQVVDSFDLVLLATLVATNPYHQLLNQRISEIKHGRIKIIETVSVEDLVSLYNAATVFVYPSRYEGFGLPPLEAMACGTPVITTNSSSVPEVVGNAGLLFSPNEPEELTSHLMHVLTDTDTQKAMTAQGLVQARKFNWERTAKKTLAVYRSLT